MVLDEPAHRNLTALAVDLLRRDGTALLGDVEERFEQKPPLRAPASEAAAGRGRGVERHELIEEEHRGAARLLLRRGRGGRAHGGDVRLRAAGADSRAPAAGAPLLEGRLAGLRVVGAQPAGTRPARLG